MQSNYRFDYATYYLEGSFNLFIERSHRSYIAKYPHLILLIFTLVLFLHGNTLNTEVECLISRQPLISYSSSCM